MSTWSLGRRCDWASELSCVDDDGIEEANKAVVEEAEGRVEEVGVADEIAETVAGPLCEMADTAESKSSSL